MIIEALNMCLSIIFKTPIDVNDETIHYIIDLGSKF